MSAVSAPKETMPVEKPSPLNRLVAIQRRFQVVQLLALVALFEWGTWTVTDFATKQSVYSMLITASFLGLAGAGQTIVVLVGGIDLSIPAFISLGAIVISDLPGLYHWAFVPALLVIIVVSVLLGAEPLTAAGVGGTVAVAVGCVLGLRGRAASGTRLVPS